MVVADIAASGRATSSPSSGVGHAQRRCISALSSLSFSLLLALGLRLTLSSGGYCGRCRCARRPAATIISSANARRRSIFKRPASGGVSPQRLQPV